MTARAKQQESIGVSFLTFVNEEEEQWRQISAAEGYIELGMYPEAHEQLALADDRGDFCLEVAIRKLDLYLLEKRWKDAAIYGEILTEFLPEEPEHYMKYATALHELGRTDTAIHVLWLAVGEADGNVERNPEYQYRLAGYELEAGTREDALLHLENAIALQPKLRERAWMDVKLRPLIAELPWEPRFVPSQPEYVPEPGEEEEYEDPFGVTEFFPDANSSCEQEEDFDCPF